MTSLYNAVFDTSSSTNSFICLKWNQLACSILIAPPALFIYNELSNYEIPWTFLARHDINRLANIPVK